MRRALHLALTLSLLGCTESPGGPDPDPDPDPDPVLEVGGAPLRTLTRTEYERTIRDLLAVDAMAEQSLPPTPEVHGFDNNARAATMDVARVAAYLRAAETIAEEVVADLDTRLDCYPGAEDLACGEQWIDQLAPRAYRRPLSEDERAILVALFDDTLAQDGFLDAARLVVEALIMSPQFLYRLERSLAPSEEVPNAVALDDFEVATRLSYLLWSSQPDEELLDAAAAGRLSGAAEIEAQARRMLEDERADDAIRYFHRSWLGLDRLATLSRLDPTWTPELADAAERETLDFVLEVLHGGEGSLTELLTASFTVGDQQLAELYGAPDVPAEGEWRRFELDPAERRGLLTHASVLASNAHPGETSIVLRGVFVLERLLCAPPPPPPADVDTTLPAIEPGLSTRERFSRHRQDAACRGCHQSIDPVGLGFEHYDELGRWRAFENGDVPVDASGYVRVDQEVHRFYGVPELTELLAGSEQVRACYVQQWFRFAYGRETVDEDATTLTELRAAFAAGDYSIRELLVAIATSPSFRTRPVPEEEAP